MSTQNSFLITGCCGFIGSALSMSLLAQGHYVVGIDNFDPFYSRAQKEFHIKVNFPIKRQK